MEAIWPWAAPAWPAPRIGATMVAARGFLWLWGGRGGKDVTPFPYSDDLWKFDPSTEEWEVVETRGWKPEPRSLHTLTVCDVSSLIDFRPHRQQLLMWGS